MERMETQDVSHSSLFLIGREGKAAKGETPSKVGQLDVKRIVQCRAVLSMCV